MDIHTALQLHSDHHIQHFLKTSKDVNVRDVREQTPLHLAASEGMQAVVKKLLKKKADINAQDSKGWTALHCATNEQHFSISQFLLQHKADPSLCTLDHASPLHYAVKGRRDPRRQADFMQSLLERVPTLLNESNYRGETALLRACMIGSDESISLLIDRKADVNARTKDGVTCLHNAVRSRRKDVVALLLKHKADHMCRSEEGSTPIDEAREFGDEEVLSVMKELVTVLPSTSSGPQQPKSLVAELVNAFNQHDQVSPHAVRGYRSLSKEAAGLEPTPVSARGKGSRPPSEKKIEPVSLQKEGLALPAEGLAPRDRRASGDKSATFSKSRSSPRVRQLSSDTIETGLVKEVKSLLELLEQLNLKDLPQGQAIREQMTNVKRHLGSTTTATRPPPPARNRSSTAVTTAYKPPVPEQTKKKKKREASPEQSPATTEERSTLPKDEIVSPTTPVAPSHSPRSSSPSEVARSKKSSATPSPIVTFRTLRNKLSRPVSIRPGKSAECEDVTPSSELLRPIAPLAQSAPPEESHAGESADESSDEQEDQSSPGGSKISMKKTKNQITATFNQIGKLIDETSNTLSPQASPSPASPAPADEDPVTRHINNPCPYWDALEMPSVRNMNVKNADQLSKELLARQQPFEEILSTETHYVRQLGAVMAYFLLPLQNELQFLLTAEQRSTIFCNIETIFDISKQLLADLSAEEAKEPHEQEIGRIFLEYKKDLSAYTPYCTSQLEAMQTLDEIRRTNEKFDDFVVRTQKARGLGEDISGYLIKPFQRICRYVLLLKELSKHTPSTWRDSDRLKAAIESTNSVVHQANETQRVMDNLMKIDQIQSKLDVQLDFKSAVKFITEGDVKENDGRGHSQKRHFFLFNNLLVVVKPVRGGRWVNKYSLPVSECIVWNVPDSDQVKNAFQIMSYDRVPGNKKKVLFECKSLYEKEAFMNAINEAISPNILSLLC